MNAEMTFDYYYGTEAEQFSFFRVPRLLFKDGRFKKLSCEAKLLYGLMLDRLSLSQRNGWLDESGRVYIIYRLDHILIDIGCGKDKAVKILAELDGEKGIGLIERKRQGQGKPTIIYVKNFAAADGGSKDRDPQENCGSPDFGKTEVWERGTVENQEDGTINFPESGISEARDSENQESRLLENRIQDFGESDASYTDYNQTEENETNPIHPSMRDFHIPEGIGDDFDGMKDETDISHSSQNRIVVTMAPGYGGFVDENGEIDREALDSMRRKAQESLLVPLSGGGEGVAYGREPCTELANPRESPYRALIRKNVAYDRHMSENPYDDLFHDFYDLACQVVEADHKGPVRVNGMDVPAEVVKSQLLKIREEHMEYAVSSYNENPFREKVRNVRAYMLTVLFNAVGMFNAHMR